MHDEIFTQEHQNKLPNQNKVLPQLNRESTSYIKKANCPLHLPRNKKKDSQKEGEGKCKNS